MVFSTFLQVLLLFPSVLECSGVGLLIAICGKFGHHFGEAEVFIVVAIVVFTLFCFHVIYGSHWSPPKFSMRSHALLIFL